MVALHFMIFTIKLEFGTHHFHGKITMKYALLLYIIIVAVTKYTERETVVVRLILIKALSKQGRFLTWALSSF